MKADYHVHTYYSDDSNTPMERQILQAISFGLDEICFTEHVDYGVKSDHDDKESGHEYNADYPEYFAEISRMREKFAGRIAIRAGLEFGVQSHTTGKFHALYERYREELDFVLLSIHQVNDLEFWTQDFQRGKTQDEYNREYYEELLRVIHAYHDYSVLAHLDLIVRYDMAGPYPFAKVRDIIAEILTVAINDGKGIELNTSSWRYGLTDTQPSREILRLYHDLGGEILTLGSDAHSPEFVAAHMDEAREILRDIGFTRFCTFEGMRAVFHAL
ncbi:MAG: histidinol-phosphatase HisJ family protein [Synergistaceae bacterium]|nr:histidinol-phosphatase HisJ family protein [Synergistaceae bacterium]